MNINEPSAFILQIQMEDTNVGKIHRALKERYPDSTDQEIGEQLAPFLTELSRNGLLIMP